VSIVTIYVFDYFEGAVGGRADNLFLSVVLNAGLAVVITAGFAAVLRYGVPDKHTFRGSHLLIAAAIACGLFHASALASSLFDYLASWQARLAVLLLYSALVGAVIGGGMLKLSNNARHAA